MQDTKQVIFKVGEEEYGLDIMLVNGIEKYTNIVKVPNAPACIKGIINLRGEVIPVYSLRRKFGLEEGQVDDNTKLIITKTQGMLLAYEVDSVQEIVEIPGSRIKEAPVIVCNEMTSYIHAIANVDNRMVVLLSQDGVITSAEKERIEKLVKE